jgi:hypothetical protein
MESDRTRVRARDAVKQADYSPPMRWQNLMPVEGTARRAFIAQENR